MRTSLNAVVVSISIVAAALSVACEDKPVEGQAPAEVPGRFAAVKREATAKAAATFCEKQWPIGEGAKRFIEPPERPVPGTSPGADPAPGAWTWVNLWATWCKPCVEEMGLLSRWKESLRKDGVALNVEFWSVDEEEKDLTSWLTKHQLPGRVHWLRSPADLASTLESLGADKASAIPIHALIDGAGRLRCLRVGSVHEEDYGAIKSMLTGT